MKKQYEEYKERKNKVIRVLADARDRISDEKIKGIVDGKIRQLEKDRFTVSVFGHFSNGKSTFLNSLMGFGREVLKEDDAPSTATITRLCYAEEGSDLCNRAEVIYRKGTREWISVDELKDFVARNKNLAVEEHIEEVVVYVPSAFLENGVEIVDTPGFNSTYKLHTEIALRQVEESDAAIFVFNCEKPGSYPEFQFLKKIRKYMNRVFFVMNKYDRSSSGGHDEITELYRKMEEVGIDTEGKIIYPLAAKAARRAIAEDNEELLEKSKLPEFEMVLSAYLLGEENIKDRLYAPLESVAELLKEGKAFVKEQIEACGKEQEELKREIEGKKGRLQDAEEEIKKKKKYIRESVRRELDQAKADLESAGKKVNDELKSKLESVNSRFMLRISSFQDITLETWLAYEQKWEDISSKLESGLMKVLDTSIDNGEYYEKIAEKINRIIRASLQMEQISVENPEFDFSGLKQLDEEIEKAKKEYEIVYKKVSDLYARKEERDQAETEIEQKRAELERLKTRKERRIDALSMVQVEYGTRQQCTVKYVRRNKIAQVILGKKRIEEWGPVEYVDDRAAKAARQEIERIERELSQKSAAAAEAIEDIKNRIKGTEYKMLDREIVLGEADVKEAQQRKMEVMQRQREESDTIEKQIIQIEKGKYLRGVEGELRETGKKISKYLDDSKSGFISVLNAMLEEEISHIQDEKACIEKMVGVMDKTPEELERELSDLVKRQDVLTDCLSKITDTREEVENAG